ncbi:hypothetical protein [Ruminococcus sp.]|uniref:hypothetical protein n=1 Tax=Ruminococcus sp. TaxID=41978 RepID=UPI0025E89303|nr:hypothetical protein [Ruminococcus sp.]
MSKKIWLHFGLVTALAAAVYPLTVLLNCWGGRSYLLAGGMTVILTVLSWLGMLHMLLLRRQYRKKTRMVNLSLWAVSALLFVGSVIFAPYPTVFLRALYGIAAGGCYFGASRLLFQPIERIAHPYVFTGLCLWNLFTGLLIHWRDESASFLVTAIILVVNAMLFALVHNMDSLERMLRSRGEGAWEMPKEIQQSNAKLMAVLCSLGIVLFCCYRPLAKLMGWLWRRLYTGVWYLLRWLLSLGSSDAVSELSEDTSKQLIPLEQNGASDWIRLIFEAVILVGLLALVIWKRREIWHGLIQCWCSLRRWIAAQLGKTRHMPQEEDGAYCDYVEDLITQEKAAVKPELPQTRRRWNRVYRRYLYMPSDAARYRLGYALVLAQLPEEMALPSDSAVEILEKLRQFGLADSSWELVTEGYDNVRYGEIQPDGTDFAALNEILRQLHSKGNSKVLP